LVKKATGASKVFIFDHTVRRSSMTNPNNLGQNVDASTVTRVHSDYTDVTGPNRFRHLYQHTSYSGVKLDEAEVEECMKKRYAFINVWRPITDTPVQVKPLAVCDTNSVDPSEYIVYELRYVDRPGAANYSMEYSDKHKWYFYPQ